MSQQQSAESDVSLISTRRMEIITAAVLAALGLLVMWDSNRIGAGWSDQGPQSGFFPFYVGLFLFAAAIGVMIYALFSKAGKSVGDQPFVMKSQMKSVLQVFIPTLGYVILMQFIGLYIALSIYIIAFMIINGGYKLTKALPFGILVPIIIFLMFEKWFLVPLPKGPIEAMLGF
jgi:putative tricarboxylic transport membrane protein